MDASLTCSRLGCGAPAVAVFAFDARESLVWLDPLGAGRGAGVLCETHADRMSPPVGWNLLDRRSAESRLWIGRTPLVANPQRRRERIPRSRPHDAGGSRLPFDAPPSREPEPAPAPAAVAPAAVAHTSWSPREKPGPELDRVLDARTPLLARAFEGARPTDEGR